MHVTIIGSGHVGLVSGAGFADFGLTVTCVDSDQQKIETLSRGELPIYEQGLEEIFRRNLENKRLNFSTDLKSAVQRSLVIFIAVGTPEGKDGMPDVSQVESAARSLGKYMDCYKVIVTKSTVPIGMTQRLSQLIKESQTREVNFDLVANPEFLREGSAIEDFMRPNRIVIGTESEQAAAIVKDIYRPLYLIETPFVFTNPETAELIKYACNAFLATKISFINEIANLCEKTKTDIHHVARAMGLDKRIGPKFLHPGPGFGGSCLPKDVLALSRMAETMGAPLKVLEAVLETNEDQRDLILKKVQQAVNGVEGKRVGVLGLSFKPNTDDIRESPAMKLCAKLLENRAYIRAYDPAAMNNAKMVMNTERIHYCTDAYDAASEVDLLLITTEWNEFRNLDLERIKSVMKNAVVVDCRNVFEPNKMTSMGFYYLAIGR